MDTHLEGPRRQEDGLRMRAADPDRRGSRGRDWWLVLLLVPFLALLYPPFYSTLRPELWGIPFFIWYQFLWVILGALITAAVYFVRD